MDFKHFPIDEFLKRREQSSAFLRSFYDGTGARVAVSQRPGYQYTRGLCRYRDRQLESELDFLADCFRYESDLMLQALEPWVGVGVYAAAFGAKYIWNGVDSPQTRPFVHSADEIPSLRVKPLGEWEEMQEVLTRIRYFKEQTHGLLGITLTDTQSPNDTASLIMDTTEFFTDCLAEPESIEPLLTRITDLIIEYSRIQLEEIGEDCYAGPGHIAISGHGVRGVTLSDDNLAILSPASYRSSSAPYMQRISDAFGGLYVHSCGCYSHNVPEVLTCRGLKMLDCAIDKTADPNPNDPEKMALALKGSDVLLQVRLNIHNAPIVKPLLDAGLRLNILFSPDPDPVVSNRLMNEFKDKYL